MLAVLALVLLLSTAFSLVARTTTTTTADTPLSTLEPPLTAKTIFQLQKGSWIENLAVRPNNEILLDVLSTPDLYLHNPSTKRTTLLHTFPEATGLLGITETLSDTYALISGNFSTVTFNDNPGSYSIWSVSFSSLEDQRPKIHKIVDIPEAQLLNGIASLPGHPETVLIGDGGLGIIWSLNTSTGRYKKLITDVPELAAGSGAPSASGVNGLKIVPGYIYFTNTYSGLYRLAINQDGSKKAGAKAETIGLALGWDDLAIDERGLWVAGDVRDIVMFYHEVHGKWIGETVIGNNKSLTVAGSTAAQFGKGPLKNILYVTTTGAKAAPVNGTVSEGGKVVAIDTSGFKS